MNVKLSVIALMVQLITGMQAINPLRFIQIITPPSCRFDAPNQFVILAAQ